ncbi:CGLD27 family protein [Acaryochloris thomasi]|nr:CGLD27 family protein [Acaryochloris thomasi]
MNVSAPGCPVPVEQQPMNEYRSLQESCFFRWATLDRQTFLIRTFLIWSLGCLFCLPIAAESFTWTSALAKCLLATTAGATGLLMLLLLRLYLGWGYICDRLYSPTIVYEETGWYDCQAWAKPTASLTQERLIVTYELRPFLLRLRYSFVILCLTLGAEVSLLTLT